MILFFSPIRRVAYEVQDTRVGQDTDFNKLELDVETNGSVTPEDAVAARILIDQFQQLVNFEDPEEKASESETPEFPF